MVYAAANGLISFDQTVSGPEVWVVSAVLFPVMAVLQNLATHSMQATLARAKASEQRFKAVVENISEVVILLDVEAQVKYISPTVEAVLGYLPAERLGRNLFELVHPDDEASARQLLAQILRQPAQPIQTEVRARRRDGTWYWVEATVKNLLADPAIQAIVLVYRDVTHRKQIEADLRLSESRYRALAQNLPNSAVILFDHELRFVLVDGPELARTGYSKEAMEGKTLFEALPPEFAQMVEPNMRAVLRGENFTAELPFGNLFYSYHYIPLYNDQEQIIYGMILAQNITASKQAELALRHSEERYRTISELISDYAYAYRVEPDGSFTIEWITSDSARRMTGYDPMQEISSSFILYHPDDQPRVNQHIQETIQGKPTSDDYRIITKTGDLRWVHIDRQPVWDPEQQRVVRFYGVSQDITERKQAELALEREHALLRTVIDNLPDYIYLKNTHYQCLVSNLANARALGAASPNDVVGKTLSDFYPPEEAEQYNALDRIVIGTGQPINQEKSFEDLTTGQRRWTWITRIPFFGPDGSILGVVGISRDITENKEAQAAREQLIADLEAKNAELERFTYTVSHDLKNPLVTIGGFLGYLEKDVAAGKTDRVMADINRIKEAAQKMQQLLDDLLELSRIGRVMNPPQHIPFEAIVREALALAHGRLAERRVTVEVAPNWPMVYGDRLRLVEVMQNLIDNAAKYMGDQPRPRIEIGWREKADQTIFFVKDNGLGIEPQYHQQIFGLFDKLDAHSEGSGIGLALVKRIVEVHGGRIWVESAGQGQGSTFFLTLSDSHIK
jgi:PAS domain S-box-containing protein